MNWKKHPPLTLYIYCLLSLVSDFFPMSVSFRQTSVVITLDKELHQEPAVVALSDQGRPGLGFFNKELIFEKDISPISLSSNFDFPAYGRHGWIIYDITHISHIYLLILGRTGIRERCYFRKQIVREACRQILISICNAWFARKYPVLNSSISKTVNK